MYQQRKKEPFVVKYQKVVNFVALLSLCNRTTRIPLENSGNKRILTPQYIRGPSGHPLGLTINEWSAKTPLNEVSLNRRIQLEK